MLQHVSPQVEEIKVSRMTRPGDEFQMTPNPKSLKSQQFSFLQPNGTPMRLTELSTQAIQMSTSFDARQRQLAKKIDSQPLVKKKLIDTYGVRANNGQLIKALREENEILKCELRFKEQ